MNLKDLETRGYVVIPKFLSKEIIDKLIADYQGESQEGAKSNVYKRLGVIAGTRSHGLDDCINHMMAQVRVETNIKVDFCHSSADYFNNNDVNFGYHQDHEPYWLWQNSYNGLNVWIPLIKEEGDKDGLYVVPTDRVSNYYSVLWGKGANRFIDNNDGSTLMINDCLTTCSTLELSLDSIRETPILYPGDALIMRADTIHASQTKTHTRVAASIRCVNTQGWVRRSVFTSWSNECNKLTQDDILYTEFFNRLSQKFVNKQKVQIQEIVLTNK